MLYYLILFCLVTYGLTQILVVGSIFKSIRPKHHFFHCSMCMGFWAGMLVFTGFWFSDVRLFSNLFVGLPVFGFVGSGVSYMLNRFISDDGINVHHG